MNFKNALDKYLTAAPEENDYVERVCNLVVYPEDTHEFDDFVEKLAIRYEENFTPEQAANYISKIINILYYRRHPAKHMQMLMAIL